MNINIPKNIKSPTVIILGKEEVDDKRNAYHEKRLDLLESKLDNQYKAFINKTDNSKANSNANAKAIEMLQRSFSDTLNKFMMMNKAMMTSMHKSKMEGLRKEFEVRIKEIEKSGDKDEILKSFVAKLGKLEGSISRINRQPIVPTSRPISHNYMAKSFESFYGRLEKAIKDARPRMIPSPS